MLLTEEQRARITQNYRAAKALLDRKKRKHDGSLEALKEMQLEHAKVLRDGFLIPDFPARELVPGDIVELRVGDKVPAAPSSPDKKKMCPSRPPLIPLNSNDLNVREPPDGLLKDTTGDENLQEIRNCERNIRSSTLPAHLQKLNQTQRDAALSDISKPLLILAGPGSGKTSTMVARVLTLLEEGVDASNILAMTFTTAASTEMRDRVGLVVGKGTAKEICMSTFHSFCLQLCRTYAERLGRTSEFLIYGPGQQRRAIIEATRLASAERQGGAVSLESENPGIWRDKAKKWQQFVTQSKSSGRTPDEIEQSGNSLGAAILRHYDGILISCNALDYHDFIAFAVRLLTEHSDVLDECQRTWIYLLVDEFQDTSAMQYKLLRLLASHNHVTVVGDDDQSIFSFNGANSSGFDSFRRDFALHKEVRLHQNYRSTGCIVNAAMCLIKNNFKRCQDKTVKTDNGLGDKILVRECRNEESQCSFVVDNILQNAFSGNENNPVYGNFAVLYRRQVTGRIFQSAFRARKIPFNIHGVAFYRKKVIKTVIALLWSSFSSSGDIYSRRVFKALYSNDKVEVKKSVEYIEKQAKCLSCTFIDAITNIFTAKVSGTFNRRQLAQGRKLLATIRMVQRLVAKETSLSSLITAVVSLLPQKPVFETRAVANEDGGKLLNEDEDSRTVLSYLLDDVSEFLRNYSEEQMENEQGCGGILKAFLNHISVREAENFRCRRQENNNSVTLTTIHQSKGLEWDTVFIVKTNELEIPLLREEDSVGKNGNLLEEERRLFYVAMTRAKRKLFITYVGISSQRQILEASRFLKELPRQFLDFQGCEMQTSIAATTAIAVVKEGDVDGHGHGHGDGDGDGDGDGNDVDKTYGTAFLRSFNVEARSMIGGIFHKWAKMPAFQHPKRLLSKIGFVIDEKLRSKSVKSKDVLHALKCSLTDDAAVVYADHVVKWEKLPLHERALLQAERQEHFQQQSSERAMSSSAATSKQISLLRSLGCTTNPISCLHASKLIEQYKAL